MKKEISLYLHIPFCVQKCNYCDFLSFGATMPRARQAYVAALCQEILSYKEEASAYQVVSVFVGGGTPSVLELEEMEAVFHAIYQVWEVASFAEITIEVNPGTVDKKKMIGYRQLGVNRLSIGLQSVNKDELMLLGRIHNYDQFLAVFHTAREAGFDNINVDLMSGLPGQTLESYRTGLNKVMALQPEHISIYSLIIEEGTPFYENAAIYNLLPDEETERRMYAFTKTVLEGYWYQRYEISNYARTGYESRHNMAYWTDGAYLGMGLGAASYLGGYRFRNTRDLQRYMQKYGGEENQAGSVREDIEQIDVRKHMEEFMFLGLRMMQGVSRNRFFTTFGRDVFEIYGQVLHKHEAAGLLSVTDGHICLTEQGISLSNIVMADFLLDEQFYM